MQRKVFFAVAAVMVALVAAVAFWQGETEPVQQLSYPQLWEAIADRQVQTVTLGNSPSVKVALTNGMLATAPNPRYAEFKSDLLMAGVTVEEKAASDISPLLGLIMAAALMAVLLRGRGQGAFAKYAQVAGDQPVPDVTFDQVAGGAEAIQSMRDLVDFLRAPEQFEAYGARVPRGVMLYGPPGTGKTLMARALAGEAKVPFFAVSGSDFVQVYVGVGASRVRTLFQKARKAGRAVVFIDEIDAIGKKRDNGNDEREQTLNALLTEMSGFANGQGVIVLAATNRLDTLDEALLRAGRFDRQIEVALPDVQERLAILKVHGKQLPLDDAVDLSQIAAQTPYFSGARLESLLNEAAILAARRGEGKIENQDVEQALIHTMAGQEKKDRQVLAREKEITCAHEAGHAIATCIRMPHTQIKRVSVIPSSRGAAGYVMSVPEDRLFQRRRDLEDHLVVVLAGRAAEETAYGPQGVTTGAAGDLQKAYQLALDMVSKWGMSPSGQVMEPSARQQEAASCLVEDAYRQAMEIIKEHRLAWLKLREELMKRETLSGDQVRSIVEI